MIGIPTRRLCFRKGRILRNNETSKLARIRSLLSYRDAKSKRLLSGKTRPHASSAEVPETDPYQILGVSQKTSPDNIQRAYRSKLHQAKADGDDDLVFIIEQAHSSIMMRELSNRMQGQVSKEIAYADKAVYLPWRPRWALADRKLMIIATVLHLLLWSYSFAAGSTTGTQPAIGSAFVCAGVTYAKLERMFPTAGGFAFASEETDRKQGFKNLARCAVLAIMGTAAGVVLFCTLPDLFSNLVLHRELPFWVQDHQDLILNTGVMLMNWLLCLFFR